MISNRISLLLGAAACAGTAAAQKPGAPPVLVPPPFHRPVPPPPQSPPPPRSYDARAPRPLSNRLQLVSGPDWGDPDIYPAAAMALDQQGPVTFELLVGRDGRPSGCTIVESSGFAELDAGTCSLAVTMRFAPPPAETTVRTRIVWQIAPDPMPFEPQRMRADLTLANGAVASCRVSGEGELVREWSRHACRTFGLEAEYYLGPRRWSARWATILVDFLPQGATLPRAAVPGAQTAIRTTAFTVDPAGDPGNCRSVADSGFGRPRTDHADACGFFVSRGYEFVAAEEEDAAPRPAQVTVRVFLDR